MTTKKSTYKTSFLLSFVMLYFFAVAAIASYLLTDSQDIFIDLLVGGIGISVVCLFISTLYVWQEKQKGKRKLLQ